MIDKYGHQALQNKDIDHIDHNPLNNKISNLRIRSIHSNRKDNNNFISSINIIAFLQLEKLILVFIP